MNGGRYDSDYLLAETAAWHAACVALLDHSDALCDASAADADASTAAETCALQGCQLKGPDCVSCADRARQMLRCHNMYSYQLIVQNEALTRLT